MNANYSVYTYCIVLYILTNIDYGYICTYICNFVYTLHVSYIHTLVNSTEKESSTNTGQGGQAGVFGGKKKKIGHRMGRILV